MSVLLLVDDPRGLVAGAGDAVPLQDLDVGDDPQDGLDFRFGLPLGSIAGTGVLACHFDPDHQGGVAAIGPDNLVLERRFAHDLNVPQHALELVRLEPGALAFEEILEAAAPQATDGGLATRAGLAQDGAGLFEVVAEKAVVPIKSGHREVAPLTVWHLEPGGRVHGLDDGPVLMDVGPGRLPTGPADVGVTLGPGGHQGHAAPSQPEADGGAQAGQA